MRFPALPQNIWGRAGARLRFGGERGCSSSSWCNTRRRRRWWWWWCWCWWRRWLRSRCFRSLQVTESRRLSTHSVQHVSSTRSPRPAARDSPPSATVCRRPAAHLAPTPTYRRRRSATSGAAVPTTSSTRPASANSSRTGYGSDVEYQDVRPLIFTTLSPDVGSALHVNNNLWHLNCEI